MAVQKTHVRTRLNGEATEFLCEANQSLLEVLRDVLLLTVRKRAVTMVTVVLALSTWMDASLTLA